MYLGDLFQVDFRVFLATLPLSVCVTGCIGSCKRRGSLGNSRAFHAGDREFKSRHSRHSKSHRNPGFCGIQSIIELVLNGIKTFVSAVLARMSNT